MICVGTSGWAYPWNEGGSLNWYAERSGLNAVELNASFYRWPSPSQVRRWARHKLAWSIKVHQSFTHRKRLKDIWGDWPRFQNLFEPLAPRFFLFQLPPSFKRTRENEERVAELAERLGDRAAVEFRDPAWYENPPDLGAVIVSIDSPLGTYIVDSAGVVYLRMHGRSQWYLYEYSEAELKEVAQTIKRLEPRDVYVFFNNDHWMLENGRVMLALLKGLFGEGECMPARGLPEARPP
ncbi:MAG: DUF72 domain-containing protein [Thermoproteus sp.]|nr:DUF72 domain-containing protein [Thermoproteus sp.]